jgi:hypothetical protein
LALSPAKRATLDVAALSLEHFQLEPEVLAEQLLIRVSASNLTELLQYSSLRALVSRLDDDEFDIGLVPVTRRRRAATTRPLHPES